MPPITTLLKNTRLRLRLAAGAVLTLGLLFSSLLFIYSEKALHSTRDLSQVQIPLLDNIAALKLEVMREESLLHDYYVTQERGRFVEDFTETQRRSVKLMDDIEHLYGPSDSIKQMRLDHEQLDAVGRELSGVNDQLSSRDRAYAVLWRAANAVRDIHANLDTMTLAVQDRTRSNVMLTRDTVRNMARLGIVFSLGVFLIALLIVKYVSLYMRESAERKRLAVFAERNPNPVMRLSLSGDVIYANTAAFELARRMGASTAYSLLPSDVRDRLKKLRNHEGRYQVWEYERFDHALECGIHFLPDLSSYHAYLTDVTPRRQSEEKLVYQAYHHPVTGLPNRRMFKEFVEQVLNAPEQHERRAAVFLLDIDRLRFVIDTLGHAVGDDVLREVAGHLRTALDENRNLAPGAVLYHFEADLFAVFVPNLASDQTLAVLAEKLAAAGSALYIEGREFSVRFSIGAAIYPIDGNDMFTLLKNADSALHRVKHQGGHAFRLYKPEMNAAAANWLSTESYLRHAIDRDEFKLYYQPQVDIRRGRVIGMEALLRWQHPERGLLEPKEFINIAEESGLIDSMGEWALKHACLQSRTWRERGLIRTTVAVNISGRQFLDQDLPRLVGKLLAETQTPPDALELEITESVAMHDVERTTAMLRELKAMGVHLAIDDFGTGFSSLAYLKRFPIDKLKIDQSFVQGVGAEGTDATIAHAIVSLGHALKLTVCAEGVETRAQLARLRQSQCDQAQGMLYSEPVPPEQMEALLRNGHGSAPSLRQH